MQQKGELLFSGRNWRLLFRAGALSFSIPSWFLTSLPRLCRGFDEEHTTFLVEYSVIGVGITGLGSVVYELLAQLTLVCAGSCLVLSVKPTAFFAEFLLSTGLVFKGTWLLQAGLCLYTDAFVLKGCNKMVLLPGGSNADVHCELEEDGMRAVALVNLLFVVHAIGVVIAGFVVFGLLSSFRNLRFGEASGPLLAELESESILMRPSHEHEME
ncbi:hypothetical protein QUC31_016433 [Theobroma cacao]